MSFFIEFHQEVNNDTVSLLSLILLNKVFLAIVSRETYGMFLSKFRFARKNKQMLLLQLMIEIAIKLTVA